MALKFTTISDELAEYAELAAEQARADGYRVKVEPSGAYFPVIPTIQGVSRQRELIIEVIAKASFSAAQKWLPYGKAQRNEIKVQIVSPPQKKNVSPDEILKFQTSGIGLSVGADGKLVHLVSPRDLSSQIICPDISKDSARVKKKLKPCFDKVQAGAIVDGFKDLAVLVEVAARKHLIHGIKSGRVKFATSTGKVMTYQIKQINRQTMGWLKDRYGEIVTPNATDNLILQAFVAVTPDRNLASHQVMTAAQKQKMHARVAKHLLVLHRAAKELL